LDGGLIMRISCLTHDTGYETYIKAIGPLIIELDGQDISNSCLMADDEKREVYVHRINLEGFLIKNIKTGRIKYERITGTVKIKGDYFNG